MKKEIFETLEIDKLVHGGQGLAKLADGRKIFVWNALPGERVKAKITKNKKDFAEGIAVEILEESKFRIEPEEVIYLATSPWQIIDFEAENKYKLGILKETFKREGIDLSEIKMVNNNVSYGYRNKIEFSFYGNDNGIHYAFYNRGTHQKQIVNSSKLAMLAINSVAKEFIINLNKLNVRAGDLKSVILRCNQKNEVVAGLFVKTNSFPKIDLPKNIKGLKVYYSNPKSPASVATKLLYELGDCNLSDIILGQNISYDVIGFFQVNIPVFEMALKKIQEYCKHSNNVVDMYSGVGSIGLTISNTKTMVELDKSNIEMAKKNSIGKNVEVVLASSEKALQYVDSKSTLIVDPPRSGIHKDLINKINEVKPDRICYLSCNPSTQARDVALLINNYDLTYSAGYNFFPRTPHIESLVILTKKQYAQNENT